LETYQALDIGQHYGNLLSEKRIAKFSFSRYIMENELALPPHFHKNGYFSFLMDGQINETINNHSYLRTPGMVVYHPADTPHVNALISRQATLFNIECVEIDKRILNFPSNFHDAHIIFDERIVKLLRSIFNDINRKIDHIQICNKVHDLYLKCEKSNCKKKFFDRPDWLKFLLNFINRNYSESITLEHLAEIVNKHPVHISRSFKKYMLCTVSAYIMKIRIEKASQIIRNEQPVLAQLAYDMGFADQSHFSRVFKKYVNVSPSLYKKMFLSNGNVKNIQDKQSGVI